MMGFDEVLQSDACSQFGTGRHCNHHVYNDPHHTAPPPYSQPFSSGSIELEMMKGCKGEDSSYSFPSRLHFLLDVLQQDGNAHLACWQPHGRCFVVHNPNEFSERVLPLWFRQSRFGSFQRQLNLYGFRRMKTGRDKGGYWHPDFLRGQPQLAQRIKRSKIKKSKLQEDDEPEEPNFYDRPFLPFTYPTHVLAVQQYPGPSHGSHYPPVPLQQAQQPQLQPQIPQIQIQVHPAQPVHQAQPIQQAQPVQQVQQVMYPPPVPSPPTNLPPNPTVAAAPHPGAPVSYPVETSLPTLPTIPHFDAEDMPVVPNENLPGYAYSNGKQGAGPGPIDVPLIKSKLLQSPTTQALAPCLAFAARSTQASFTNQKDGEIPGAPAPAPTTM